MTMKRKALMGVCVIVVFLISQLAQAQAAGSLSSRSGRWNLGGAIGLTFDPDLFGVELGVDYYITNEIAVEPLIIAMMNGEDNLWGLSGQVKYSALLAENDVVRPYGHIGIGFINLDLNNGKPKTKFLFPVGGGFEFELNDDLSLDVNALFIISEITSAGLFAGIRYLF
jgi:opacity protein-like surface antigen